MTTATFFVELGVEELPITCMPKLIEDFSQKLIAEIDALGLSHASSKWFSTPRRLAVMIHDLQTQQEDREQQKRGPAVDNAFDKDGNPSKAAEGFARSCGVALSELERLKTDKGEWLAYTESLKGQATKTLLPDIIQHAIKKVALPKRMRWGAGLDEFIRPIHWVCCLLNDEVVDFELMGIASGRQTHGHRFHHPEAFTLKHANDYESILTKQAKVIPDWHKRRDMIRQQITEIETQKSVTAIVPDTLLDVVTNLNEWPVVLVGEYDHEFLSLPAEVLCAVMNDHQKCFALRNDKGELVNQFILVSNIESQKPESVLAGNQKVMHARMSDGAFFYETDSKKPLVNRIGDLQHVMYVKSLGNMHDRATRLAQISQWIAIQLNENADLAFEAGMLAKTDLVTDMVGEFPELQGMMGYYYAQKAGLNEAIALCLRDQYLPDSSGSKIPETKLAQAVALADKIDTLVGIFGINKAPSGDKDPFACRRAAVGIVRIILEGQCDIDLKALIEHITQSFTVSLPNANVVDEVLAFILERLRAVYHEKSISVECLNAVLAKKTSNLLDLDKRIHAVNVFRQMSEAESLAAANKRVSRILIKEKIEASEQAIDASLFDSNQEKNLAKALEEKALAVQPYLENRDYTQVLQELSTLQHVIDDFFDNVMVMDEDKNKRANRLALLIKLRQLFLSVADISLLQ